MRKFTFIKNAAILTATALILRTLGIFFRIYMSNAIGAEGMGLYQLIFSVYVLAAAFAAGGFPPPSPGCVPMSWPAAPKNPPLKSCARP